MKPANELLIREAGYAQTEGQWLIIGGDAELVRAVLDHGNPDGLVWTPFDVRELQQFGGDPRAQIHANPVLAPGRRNMFDVVVIPGSTNRDLNRRSLVVAKEAVSDSGWVTIAGANKEGVRSFISDAQSMFGDPFYTDYKFRNRIATFEGTELLESWPSWSAEPGIAPGTWIDTGVILARQRVMHATTAGVFSSDDIDEGTRMLLENLRVEPGQRVLDVGTGSGLIGAYAASMGGDVTMVDVSLIASATASRTVELNEFEQARVVAGDVYEPVADQQFDLIVSNPPFHRGRSVDHSVRERLLRDAPRHLQPNGEVLVVSNVFLGLERGLRSQFLRVETVESNRKYQVVRAQFPFQ